MKTKKLIAMLQEIDPSGEFEVCVDNLDIYFAEPLPAYWDGRLQLLIQDESKEPHYSIVGAKVTAVGTKIKLHTMGVEDVLWHDPDAPIDLSEANEANPSRWEKIIEEIRAEVKNVKNKLGRGNWL
jgi:hypothetical protein